MIYLDSGDQDISHPGAATEHLHWKAGDVVWSPAGGMHIAETVSDGTLRIVEIEIKQPAPATEPKRARNLDPLAIDPGHNKLIFENPQVRVFRSTRNSGDREKWHEHVGAGRAVVLLSDLSGARRSGQRHVRVHERGSGRRFLERWIRQAPRIEYRQPAVGIDHCGSEVTGSPGWNCSAEGRSSGTIRRL